MTFASSSARRAKWARAAGAFEAGPPVVVGHSFGGRIAVGLAHDFGDELAAAVMVDPPFFAPQNQRNPAPPRRDAREHSVRPSLEAIIARFRLAPPQACDNLFILDFIARRSARKAVDAEGKRGLVVKLRSAFLGEVRPARPGRDGQGRALRRSRSSAARSRSSSSPTTRPIS